MSGHGSGETLFQPRRPARRSRRSCSWRLFKFIGNPMQRGFWPRSLLFERLQAFGAKDAAIPSSSTRRSSSTATRTAPASPPSFPPIEPERVWGWVSMRPGITFQVYQPGAAQVPGLVIFGEDDPFLARPSQEENLAVVPALRKKHGALWNFAVEPKTGHGPGEKTWPLVFSFLRHTFAARVPADADPRKGPVKLNALRARERSPRPKLGRREGRLSDAADRALRRLPRRQDPPPPGSSTPPTPPTGRRFSARERSLPPSETRLQRSRFLNWLLNAHEPPQSVPHPFPAAFHETHHPGSHHPAARSARR